MGIESGQLRRVVDRCCVEFLRADYAMFAFRCAAAGGNQNQANNLPPAAAAPQPQGN
eukprot:EC794579.1.p5 GENE.EC794579.1~~EC794579.1.p5  ORF type:complete len:57 (+),score=10.33 EC794579.1:378-548(+)